MILGFAQVAFREINPENDNSKYYLKLLAVWMVKGPRKIQEACQLTAGKSFFI